MTADKIKELIGSIHGISLIEDFIIDEAGSLKGRIAVVTDQEHADLEWYVEISPTYPFKIDLLVKTGAETPQKQENATL